MIWIWLAVVVLSAIIEAISWDMTSIWVTCGGIIALILCACGVPILWQLVPFIVITVLCIIFLRPLVKKSISKGTVNTNISSFIGQKAKIVKEISEFSNGTIKINGVTWSAQSKDGLSIATGTEVEIVEVLGNKLIVKQLENNTQEAINNNKNNNDNIIEESQNETKNTDIKD